MLTAWYALRSLVFYIGYAAIMVGQTLASVAIMPFVSRAFLHRFTVTACRVSVRWARVACGIRYELVGRERMLAVKAGVPVLPIALNSGVCWPRGTLIKRPGLLRVVIGEPIANEDIGAKVLNAQVRDWIEATMTTL